MKIVKHKRGKPLKSVKKIVLNVLNKFKRIYEFMFKQICFPYTSKRTRHRSVVTVLGTCMCHKHMAPMAEGYITQILFKLANQRLKKAHGFVDIRIVVPLNLVWSRTVELVANNLSARRVNGRGLMTFKIS